MVERKVGGMLRSTSWRLARVGVLGVVAVLLLLAGVAFAASTPSKTTSTAKRAVVTYAPAKSPVDVAGHPEVRKGTALPAGSAIVAREGTVTRGEGPTKSANPVLMTCPGTRTITGVGPGNANFDPAQVYGKKTGKLYPSAGDAKGRPLSIGDSRPFKLYVLCSYGVTPRFTG